MLRLERIPLLIQRIEVIATESVNTGFIAGVV